MKRQLQKAIAALSDNDASTHAESLAGKIAVAFMQYGRSPNASAVAKELQKIADLSRTLHRSLNHATSPAVQHIANAYGGYGNFRLIRRDMLAKLDTLYRATNLTKTKRGAKPDLYAKAVADAAAATYQNVTGRKPTRVTNSDTYEARGIFLAFLTAVFAAAKVHGAPITHVQRITAGRRARRKIAA